MVSPEQCGLVVGGRGGNPAGISPARSRGKSGSRQITQHMRRNDDSMRELLFSHSFAQSCLMMLPANSVPFT
ncbi:unnamed protein product [Caretta caretta]